MAIKRRAKLSFLWIVVLAYAIGSQCRASADEKSVIELVTGEFQMKKFATIGMAVVGFMAVAGFSVAEIREYLQVAGNRVSTSVRDSIPLSVEIDRMEVLLTKLDGQVSQQKYAVAKSKVALQDAEAEYQRAVRDY